MKYLFLILMLALMPQTIFSQSEYTDYQVAMWLCKSRDDIQPDYYMNTEFDCRVNIHYPNLIQDFNDMNHGLIRVTNYTHRECLILTAIFVRGAKDELIDFLVDDTPFNNILGSIDDDYTRGVILDYVKYWMDDSQISTIRRYVVDKNIIAWKIFQNEKCGTLNAKWLSLTDHKIH